MWPKLWRDIASRQLFVGPPQAELTTDAELAALPPAARDCMRFHGVTTGQAKRWSLRLGWRGRFRLGPSRPWMPIDAVQYNTRQPVARIFHMRARMNLLPVLARDIYANGHGHMRAKIAHLVTVADGKGPEFDQGELVTWVNDCVLFAPSMLLAVSTTWSHVDARTFDLAFTDRGNTVTARVFIDERGAPINFESRDRYLNDPADPKHPLIRAPWTTPIEGWQRIYEHMVPARGRATWHLADSDFTYAEFDLDPASVAFDELPASAIGVRAA